MNSNAVELATLMGAIALPIMFIVIGVFMGLTVLIKKAFPAGDED